jgi:DNA polymerase I-like protein with 3'-5' exonuclease and polymerase domains
MTRTAFRSVSRSRPCAICGGIDGCSRGEDGSILCRRPPDATPHGYIDLGECRGDPQYRVYRAADDPVLRQRNEERQRQYREQRRPPSPNGAARHGEDGADDRPDMEALARRHSTGLTPERAAELAQTLGLRVDILARFPLLGFCGTDPHGPCWTFAEANGGGRVIGVLRRYRDGKKLAVESGGRGLIVPQAWDTGEGPIFAVEGPSDTLALAALNLSVVGRPSNFGGVPYLAELLKDLPADREIVVVGEWDQNDKGQWPGRDGAVGTAARLAEALRRPVKWTLPPKGSKDVRAWLVAQDLPGDCLDAWHEAGDRLRALLTAKGQDAKPEPSPGGTAPKKAPAPEPYRPFPVGALPEPIAEYVRQGALALGCDAAYLALPALAVAAGMIGHTRVLRLKRTWRVPCVLWTLVVADSGSLKSPAFRLDTDHLFTLQKRLDLEYKRKLAEYGEPKEEWEAATKAAKKGEGDPPGDEPEPPVRQTLFTSDATIEAVAELIGENPRGLLVACDELAGWLGSFTRYKGKAGGTDLPRWLSMHSAGGFAYHRKTGERRRIVVPHAAVSIAGGIQPGILARALAGEFFEAGLAGRLHMAMPPRPAKVWTEMEIDPDAERRYHDLLDSLHALEFDRHDGEDAPHVLKLSAAAKASWVAWYNAWAREQGAVDGELAAAYSKLEEAAARFALLHSVVSRVARGEDDLAPVGADSIDAGVTLARWFARETRRVYRALAETEEERDTRRLVEFIRARGGRITVKGLQRSNSRKYPDADSATRALDALAEAGYGYWQDRVLDARGGRPTRDFILHPTIDDTDDTPPGGEGDDDDAPTKPPDDTPPAPDETPQQPAESGVSSVSSVVGKQSETRPAGVNGTGKAAGGFVGRPGVSSGCSVGLTGPSGETNGGPVEAAESSPPTAWQLVRNQAGLASVMQALDESARVGLDTETTGLDPRTDRVRLLTLATDRGAWVVDCFAVDPRPLFGVLAERPLVIHNAVFDLGFLQRLGFVPGVVHDTILLSRLLHGTRRAKGFHGLEECVARELGRTLDKRQQKSDWSGELTAEQLAYALLDAAVLVPLYEALDAQVREAGMAQAAEIERRCLPAVAWLSEVGVGFDADAWAALAAEAVQKAEGLARALDEAAPARDGYLMKSGAWEWDSPQQVQEALALLGHTIDNTTDDTLAGIDHPLAGLLRDYRPATKLASTYGPAWGAKARHAGRIYAGWQQLGADSGRMACSAPNLQNLPRDKRYRRCFIAPDGRVLVKADYSQIELRIAAKVSGDGAMLAAYRAGEDLHTLTARRVLGLADVTEEHRQLAKAVNFGLLYGMGATGFRLYARSNYNLDLTEGEAGRYREAFFAAYPGLRRWHRSVPKAPMATRTLAGRRRQGVTRFTEKLNTPVQGTGADGLKLALALLWERRGECPGVTPVLAVHDEIVVECDAGQADAVTTWLKTAMLDAMVPLIDPVPVEVEAKVGRTWAGD